MSAIPAIAYSCNPYNGNKRANTANLKRIGQKGDADVQSGICPHGRSLRTRSSLVSCHSERSEESLTATRRFFAALRMTGAVPVGTRAGWSGGVDPCGRPGPGLTRLQQSRYEDAHKGPRSTPYLPRPYKSTTSPGSTSSSASKGISSSPMRATMEGRVRLCIMMPRSKVVEACASMGRRRSRC
jgi:hypothetical protein